MGNTPLVVVVFTRRAQELDREAQRAIMTVLLLVLGAKLIGAAIGAISS